MVRRVEIGEVLPEEALVRIRRVGICGTDYHAYRGNQPFFSYPRVLGHELGAEIVALGSDEKLVNLQVGDRVSVEPYINCQTCQACRSGHPNCCDSIQVLGVHTDGGLTEYLKIPIRKLHKSGILSFDQLALVETLGIGLHAVNRAGVKKSDKVLIIGAGPIGLSVAQFCKLNGALVGIADMTLSRLDFTEKHGLSDRTIQVEKPLTADCLRGYFDSDLPNVIFDATGNRSSMLNTFELVSHGGRVVYVGLFQGEVTFNDPNFHRREISLHASRNSLPADFRTIISLMEENKINTTPWLSHRTFFDRLPDTFQSFLHPDQDLIKAIVEM